MVYLHSRSKHQKLRIDAIRQRAEAKKRTIKVIDVVKATPGSRISTAAKRKQAEKNELAEFQNSIQMQTFRSFVTHAESVLEEYQQHLMRDTTVDDQKTISSKRMAELEFHNKELKQKCEYLSAKNKMLLSQIGNSLPLVEEEQNSEVLVEIIDQEVVADQDVIAEQDVVADQVVSDQEVVANQKPTRSSFICHYCVRKFGRKANLSTHMNTCKTLLALLPKKHKYATACKFCKKKMLNNRKLSVHLWSIIKQWDRRQPRGGHEKKSLEEHEQYRKIVLKKPLSIIVSINEYT